MALDRPDDDFGDFGDFDRPGWQVPGGDVPARRWSVRQMRGGGEYGLLTIEIAASLAKHHAPVTPEERDELRELLEAMGMPADPIEQLNVQA